MPHDDQHNPMRETAKSLALDGYAAIIACPCGQVTFAIPAGKCTLSDAIASIVFMLDGIDRMVSELSNAHGVPECDIRAEIDRLHEIAKKGQWNGTFTRVEKQD